MHFAPLFPLLFAYAAYGLPSTVKRDVTTVSDDLSTLQSGWSALNQTINLFAAIPIFINSLAMHVQFGTLNTQTNQTQQDISSSTAFSQADGETVLTALQSLQVVIGSTLQNLDAQRTTFTTVPLSGSPSQVESDLETLNSLTADMNNNLIGKFPILLLPQLLTGISTTSTAFAAAVAVYASSS